MSSDGLRGSLKRAADRAGVEKPVNPHNFRHTAISRLSREGYSPQEIQHIAGWVDDRMLEKYDHTTDHQRNEQIGLKAGYIDEADAETEPSTPQTCGNCRETLAPGAHFCPKCGVPTTEKAEVALEEQKDRLFESATAAEGELADAVREFRRLQESHPALREVSLSY